MELKRFESIFGLFEELSTTSYIMFNDCNRGCYKPKTTEQTIKNANSQINKLAQQID